MHQPIQQTKNMEELLAERDELQAVSATGISGGCTFTVLQRL